MIRRLPSRAWAIGPATHGCLLGKALASHSYNRHTIAGRVYARTLFSRAAKTVANNPQVSSKVASKFPKFMAKYANSFVGAPVSFVTTFLIVHELTAVVPLFGIWGALAYFDIGASFGVPDWVVDQGTDFIRKMAERNGWTYLATAEKGSKLLMQGATSYAIVKALLPLRLIFSVLVTPWTAKRVVIPFASMFGRAYRRVFRIKSKGGPEKDRVSQLPDELKKKKVPEDPLKKH